jgi:hypothetical protein
MRSFKVELKFSLDLAENEWLPGTIIDAQTIR